MAIQLKCHACQKTLQVADSAAGKKARCPGCQALVDIPAATSQPTRDPPAAKPVQSPSPVQSVSSLEKVRISCQACGKLLQVSITAAGKSVRCPGCQSLVVVPTNLPVQSPTKASRPTSNPASKPQSDLGVPSGNPSSSSRAGSTSAGNATTGNGLWDALAEVQSSAPSNPQWNAPVANPYATSSPGYAGSASTNRSGSTSSRTPFYIINGILISLWGILLTLAVIIRIVGTIYTLATLPQTASIDFVKFIPFLIGLVLAAIAGPLQLWGGIQMFMRGDLQSAKNAAILAAIPCFGGCAFPFGIWAAILLYSDRAKRDFGYE
jgi:phage FluMu protein Com